MIYVLNDLKISIKDTIILKVAHTAIFVNYLKMNGLKIYFT